MKDYLVCVSQEEDFVLKISAENENEAYKKAWDMVENEGGNRFSVWDNCCIPIADDERNYRDFNITSVEVI